MSKEDSIEVTGTVVEKFPSGLFSVALDQERTVLAHLAGKLRRNRIRVLAGDRVTMELSPIGQPSTNVSTVALSQHTHDIKMKGMLTFNPTRVSICATACDTCASLT